VTAIRNGICACLLLVAWLYLYVPNGVFSFSSIARAQGVDVLFLWLPALLAVISYLSIGGSPWIRLGLAIAPPILLIGTVYLLGILAVVSGEYAASTILRILLSLRAYIVALALCAAIVEVARRLMAKPGTS